MDSVTQIVLGAAVAESCIGRAVGRRASIYGAVVATLPDLDVFVPLGGVVEDFVYHRSASHSLLVLSLVAPLIAYLIHRWQASPNVSFRRWWLAIWLVLVTHPLLDAFTIYGTQLLWPISDHPFGLGSIFIIDPLYTVPLALGVLAMLVLSRKSKLGLGLNVLGIALSSSYLAFGVYAQNKVHAHALQSLSSQQVSYLKVETLAAPFSSLAWRVIVVAQDAYYVAYHSLVEPAAHLRLRKLVRDPELLQNLQNERRVLQLQQFTKGSYTVQLHGNEVWLSDLRMGIEPDRFAFTFVLGEQRDETIVPVEPRRITAQSFRKQDLLRLREMWAGAAQL